MRLNLPGVTSILDLLLWTAPFLYNGRCKISSLLPPPQNFPRYLLCIGLIDANFIEKKCTAPPSSETFYEKINLVFSTLGELMAHNLTSVYYQILYIRNLKMDFTPSLS